MTKLFSQIASWIPAILVRLSEWILLYAIYAFVIEFFAAQLPGNGHNLGLLPAPFLGPLFTFVPRAYTGFEFTWYILPSWVFYSVYFVIWKMTPRSWVKPKRGSTWYDFSSYLFVWLVLWGFASAWLGEEFCVSPIALFSDEYSRNFTIIGGFTLFWGALIGLFFIARKPKSWFRQKR